MVTIRASELGIIQIDRARRRKGWLEQSEIWCRTAHTSRATLKRFWRRELIDLIALWGIGGIGKLAAEWVESQVRLDTREDQFEAVFWVSIHAEFSLATLNQSLTELLRTDATQIFTLIQHHRILLILDNWEMLLGGGSAGQVTKGQ
jgi:hypothetical protein